MVENIAFQKLYEVKKGGGGGGARANPFKFHWWFYLRKNLYSCFLMKKSLLDRAAIKQLNPKLLE